MPELSLTKRNAFRKSFQNPHNFCPGFTMNFDYSFRGITGQEKREGPPGWHAHRFWGISDKRKT